MRTVSRTILWQELAPGRIVAGEHTHTPGSQLVGAAELQQTARLISPRVLRTPTRRLEDSPVDAVAKLECLQRTGSFKIRGAASRMLSMREHERRAGVVAASSGNHGLAVATLAADMRLPATICVPRTADTVKLAAIRATGAEVHADSGSYDEAESRALELAAERGASFVHAFDDLDVIRGQATVGLELVEQVPDLGAVLMPMSGGGLAAGVALALRAAAPGTRLIGISAQTAPALYRALLAGRPVDVEQDDETLAGALSGGLSDANQYTVSLTSALLDEAWLVSERDIATAMLWGQEEFGTPVEGAGAAALAALSLPWARTLTDGGAIAVVVSGGNVDEPTLERARLLARG